MKILYAIQGTGNGHSSRAREIYLELTKYADVDVLISGSQVDLLPDIPIAYRLNGLSFVFGKHGGINIWQTIKRLRFYSLIKDIHSLPITQYDLVINDFEPISAWACRLKNIRCVALSHQYAVYRNIADTSGIKKRMQRFIIKSYAPFSSGYGFDFRNFEEDIFTPLIRKEIRQRNVLAKDHYTVYLPAYKDAILLRHLSQFPDIEWQIFSKHNKKPFTRGNISIKGIENNAFVRSIATCSGVVCGAGFASISEALYLGKKVLVVPMRMQFEQSYNTAYSKDFGVVSVKKITRKFYPEIQAWIEQNNGRKIDFPDGVAGMVKKIIDECSR